MELVSYLQSLSTTFLTTVATVFEFLGKPEFFILLFAIMFLIYNKSFAYKFWISYTTGFVVGSLILKNVIARQRPYQVDESLLSMREGYSGSMPSATTTLVSTNASYTFAATKTKKNVFLLFVSLLIICLLTGFTQLYFANNYLLDVIIGLVLGLTISVIILKCVKVSTRTINNLFYILFPLSIIGVLCFSLQLFTNNFANSAVLEFLGITASISLGSYIENKKIKYEVKNNLIFTSFKVAIILIVLIGYNYLCKLLPGIVIFSFLKFFVAGIIVTIILPLIFKRAQKYFYIFSPNVKTERVVNSFISLSERGTKKLARKIYKSLKLGEVVLLSGDLGAGKSVLVRAMLNSAGVNKNITSPTFTLVNNYQSNSVQFYHFDMYRMESEEEVINIGFDEIIDDKKAIKFIEWPEKVETHLPRIYKKITIVKLGKKSRNIIVEEYNY